MVNRRPDVGIAEGNEDDTGKSQFDILVRIGAFLISIVALLISIRGAFRKTSHGGHAILQLLRQFLRFCT